MKPDKLLMRYFENIACAFSIHIKYLLGELDQGRTLGLHLLTDDANVGPSLQGALEGDMRSRATCEKNKIDCWYKGEYTHTTIWIGSNKSR